MSPEQFVGVSVATRAKLGIYARSGLLSLGKDGDFLKLGGGSSK